MAGQMANLEEYPAFWCDARFGGLARWLRAAGYDAAWVEGIDDADLIRRVLAGGQILLTADTRLMEHGAVRSGRIRAILVPRDRDKVEQLRFVIRTLGLERREPRCMACGGRLAPIPKEAARPEVPARTLGCCDAYYRCTRCAKVFWEGTHWRRIAAKLDSL